MRKGHRGLNLEADAQKMWSLEGLKVFHTNGSCGKLAFFFLISEFFWVPLIIPDMPAKLQKNLFRRRESGDIFMFRRKCPGKLHVYSRWENYRVYAIQRKSESAKGG